MLRRNESKPASIVERERFPPVEFVQLPKADRRKDATIPGGGEEDWRMAFLEACQGGEIEVVIMIVAEQHDIDPRQRFP
jgi:hypothetical protein